MHYFFDRNYTLYSNAHQVPMVDGFSLTFSALIIAILVNIQSVNFHFAKHSIPHFTSIFEYPTVTSITLLCDINFRSLNAYVQHQATLLCTTNYYKLIKSNSWSHIMANFIFHCHRHFRRIVFILGKLKNFFFFRSWFYAHM